MRTARLRVLPVGLGLCALMFFLDPLAPAAQLSDDEKTYLEMASVLTPISNARNSDCELHKRRRIPRVGTSASADSLVDRTALEAEPFQVLASIRRWQKHFGSPVICNMIFCHGSCADYDDSCPSFRHSLLQNLLEENIGCNLQPRTATSASSSDDQVEKTDACCVDRTN